MNPREALLACGGGGDYGVAHLPLVEEYLQKQCRKILDESDNKEM